MLQVYNRVLLNYANGVLRALLGLVRRLRRLLKQLRLVAGGGVVGRAAEGLCQKFVVLLWLRKERGKEGVVALGILLYNLNRLLLQLLSVLRAGGFVGFPLIGLALRLYERVMKGWLVVANSSSSCVAEYGRG